MKIILAMLIGALILAGCAAPEESPFVSAEFDWCYIFNLNQENGFLIENGIRNGTGLESDSDGLLNFEYQYDRNVYAKVLYVTVVRPFDVVGDITVRFGGNVFGITPGAEGVLGVIATTELTMPDGVDTARLEFRQNAYTEADIAHDKIVVFSETLDGKRINIAQLESRGGGSVPFPYSTCNGTPTPSPTPPGDGGGSPTPTTTPTPTPTGTLPATPEPSDNWACYWDFTLSDAGWTADGFFAGTTRDSGGWKTGLSGGYYRGLYISKNLGGYFTTTRVTIDMTRTAGTGDFADGANKHVVSGYYSQERNVQPPSPLILNAEEGYTVNLSDMVIQFFTGTGAPDPGGEVRIRSVKLEGTGIGPSDCDTEPTPTPSTGTPAATSTGGPTATAEPLYSACLDFRIDAFSFDATGAIYVDGRGFVQANAVWKFGRSGLVSGAKKKVKLQFATGQSFSGQIRLSDNATNHTSWKTVSGNTVIVDYSGESWFPNNTFWVEFDGNLVPLALEKLCWMDPNPATSTPQPMTGTPPSRTPLPTPVSVTPSRTPFVLPIITTTPNVISLGTPIGSGGSGGTPVATATGGSGGSGTSNVGTGGGGEVADILGFLGQIGSGLGNAGGAYMGQISGQAGALIKGMQKATPQPIGGLPLCMTNPMQSDICAIYYILDWTIFAPNTPGALIIPLILILINFSIAIRVARWGFKLAQRAEDTTGE